MSGVTMEWLALRLRSVLVDGVAKRRPPDFIIGDDPADPYLRRWWVIPRNRWFNIYLHQFLKNDDDRALHDHPWVSLSIAIDGHMIEVYRHRSGVDAYRQVARGAIIFRRPRFAHRMLVKNPAWTLFITGPVVREWGFLCPGGWTHWRQFTSPANKGGIGRGCGE